MTMAESIDGPEIMQLKQEIARLKAGNDDLEKLVTNVFHQTMADPAAKSDGTSVYLPAEAVEAIKAVGGEHIRKINPLSMRPWDAPHAEQALKDMRLVREKLDDVGNSVRKLYWHHDVCYGSALMAHIIRMTSRHTRDSIDMIVAELEKDIEAGGPPQEPSPSPWETGVMPAE